MPTDLLQTEAAWSDCESVIRGFEDAWQDDRRPALEAFLPEESPHRTQLLVELVHVELEFRLRRGEFARAEDYLGRFPELAGRELTLDIVRAEFTLRGRYTPPVWAEELWLRFPDLMADLRPLAADTDKPGPLTPSIGVGRGVAEVGRPAIPGYEVLTELGRGGMGVVWKARDIALNRAVAVKTFAAAPSADARVRFAREAEAIARLDHPHIVPVYEVGEWGGGVPFFVMKCYPGGLDGVPAGPGTDLRGHARTVAAVALAVHHAHQRGILHRDLKPSNILVDEAGRPHVADFGLAGRFDPDEPATRTAAVVGTPAFMAPEQAKTPKAVTTAADVYGLGAILYQRLTGRPPFLADTPLATLHLASTTTAVRPGLLNPGVTPDLETVCLKCLEKDPARRYGSAAELADDLGRWLGGRPVVARPVSAWGHAWRWVRRHPLAAWTGTVAALALVAFVASVILGDAAVQKKEAAVREALDREIEARCALERQFDRERHAHYLERVAAAGRLAAANQLPAAWRRLDECPAELRGWEWRLLDGLRTAGPIGLPGHEDRVTAAAFVDDDRLATGDRAGEVRVWDLAGKTVRKAWRVGGPVTGLDAHPDRPWLAVSTAAGVGVWDPAAGTVVRDIPGADRLVFSRCGRWAATAGHAGVRVWPLPAWGTPRDLPGAGTTALAFTPDGNRLLTGGADGVVRSWDPATGAEVGEPWRRPRSVDGLAFTSDGGTLIETHQEGVVAADPATGRHRHRVDPTARGRTVVAAGREPGWVGVVGPNSEVVVWDADRRGPARVLHGHTAAVAALAFSPNGCRMASAGVDRVVRVWDLTDNPEVRTLAEVDRSAGGLAVAPGGQRVAVGPRPLGKGSDDWVVVLDGVTGRELRRLPGVGGIAYHPDGQRLAGGRPGGGVVLWDAETGQELWHRPAASQAEGPRGSRVTFSPDGSRLASWDQRDRRITFWDVADGSAAAAVDAPEGFVTAIEYSPDGSRLAVATAAEVRVYDLSTGQRVRWEVQPGGATALAYSPNGVWLATADPDHVVRLRETVTGRPDRECVGHPARVNALAFNAAGTRLVSAGSDKTARVWDAGSGAELLALPGVGEAVVGVAWDRKTDRVYALDDAVRVWPAR